MRAVALLLLPVAIAGVGAAMLRQGDGKSRSAPAALADTPGAARSIAGRPTPVEPTIVGMNLGSLGYYSGEWAFNDLVKTSASIRFVDPKGGWPEADTIFPFDRTGHPVHIPKGTKLAVLLQSGTVRVWAGRYDCTIADGWSVEPFGEWKMKGSGTRFTMIADQPVPASGITLVLTATRNDAALSSLACLRQGGDDGFNPTFLAEARPYKVLRFMDWMQTNNAPKRIWGDRPTPTFLTQGGLQGVSLEHMVALANTTGADPWFTMPFDADPAYYASFARYVRDNLDPRLKAYVEYSNEVWNEAFEQGKAATKLGQERYPGLDATTANDFYYADRVRDVMAIWTQVFTGQRHRLVRVLSEQASWPDRAARALAHEESWKSVDALAIAPYFDVDPYTLSGTSAMRVDALFARAPEIVDQAIRHAVAASKTAQKYNLRLVAYEGGPSFVGYQKDIGADMLAANRDSRIYGMYMNYLMRWKTEVGGLIVLFDAVSTPGPGGQFGHREYTGQPLADAPKARAVLDFIARNSAR